METKDVVFLLVGILMQLTTVVIAQMVIAKREKNNRTMQLFYDLVGHLDAFKMAFFASSSHALRREEYLRRYDQYAERIKKLEVQRSDGHYVQLMGMEHKTDAIDAEIRNVQQAIGREDRESNEESVRTTAELRRATSALTADCLLLEMLYHSKATPLIESLNSLKSKTEVFEGITPDYVKVCWPIAKELPATIERIQKDVTEFWRTQIREAE